ncbi:MAG: cytochrome B [Bacteroidetes bacterium]|nr:MAG: cytochrome B [Bacteroidota bacterium]
MYLTLLTIHSWLRWVLLAVLLFALVRSLMGWLSKTPYTKIDNLAGVLSIAFAHTQLVLGLVLYFVSDSGYPAIAKFGMGVMKDSNLRKWSVEHITMMVVAIVLVQVGRSLSKKQATDEGKHKRMATFLIIALALIALGIPAERLGLFRF